MATQTVDRPTDERLNDLYWNSSKTVDEIVNEMGVGRNTLYGAVRPMSAEARCATCGGDLEYTNRTDRAASVATCASCGIEATLSPPEDSRTGKGRANRFDSHALGDTWDRFSSGERSRVAVLGGAAAIGAMFGAVAIRSMRS